MPIRNPVEWGWDQIKGAAHVAEEAARERREDRLAPIAVRRIELSRFPRGACRRQFAISAPAASMSIVLCVIYPVIGLVLGRWCSATGWCTCYFPMAAGFALVGPFAALGLYEISRRREQGLTAGRADAIAVHRAPAIGAIVRLGLLLTAIFLVWMLIAQVLYVVTVGVQSARRRRRFRACGVRNLAGLDPDRRRNRDRLPVRAVGAGDQRDLVSDAARPPRCGCGDGDRDLGPGVPHQSRPDLRLGIIVAAGLVIGSIPFLVGLAITLPVLGHGTWHLYRRVVIANELGDLRGGRSG